MKDELLWNEQKRKLQCDILDKDSEAEEDNKEEFYAGKETSTALNFITKIIPIGLDPEYMEYLKAKKQKALDAEQHMTDEQKQSTVIFLEYQQKILSFSALRS